MVRWRVLDRRTHSVVVAALLGAMGTAYAQPAPLADQASGIAVDEPTPLAEDLRWVPRVIMFVPRWTFWLVMQPVRLGGWAYQHYHLSERLWGTLFNVDRTYGLYPVAKYSTDYGVTVGARLVHYNVFSKNETLRVGVDYGGEFKGGVGLQFTSGQRVADQFTASLEARLERRPGERFFGIGNADELDMPPPALIDPSTSDAAVSTRFREELIRFKSRFDIFLAGPLSARFSGALAVREFDSDEDESNATANVYDTSQLPGFESGVENIYLEGELLYDSRRPTNVFQTQSIDATGWYLAAHVGRAKGIRGDPTAFTRYGAEVQRFFDLYRGSRVLTLRLLVEGIAGSDGRTDGQISFADLPKLGGTEYLRGYPVDRFRDRTITLATAEYTWDLGNYFAAYLFGDAGGAWRHLGKVDAGELHVGFGGGIQVHSYRSFLFRGQLAMSREGDAFLELAVSPAFGRRERAGRY